MPSKTKTIEKRAQKISSMQAGPEEGEAFQFISAVMVHMDRKGIELFRAEVARHDGTKRLLMLIEGHLALRDILTGKDCQQHGT